MSIDLVIAGSRHASFSPAAMRLKTSAPPMRSTRYSGHTSSVHASPPASANGMIPLDLNRSTAAISSVHVPGGWTPWSEKTFLL
jgi:hypothetical protein